MVTTSIASRLIGSEQSCYIIAEIGNNHNGDPEKAIQNIRAAADAGADAIKFQTFKAEDIHNPTILADAYDGFDASDKFEYWIEYVRSIELNYDHYDRLIAVANECGVDFLSTPASDEALNFLMSKNIAALKIASMDLNNFPFLEKCAASGMPTILSTGMADLDEIDQAVKLFKASAFSVLYCVSNYPTEDSDANLSNIKSFIDRYPDKVVGFSSHLKGSDLEPIAVAIGANLIEKHFTLDQNDTELAEHHVSLDPIEFKKMVDKIRRAETALGIAGRGMSPEEYTNRDLARRSVVAENEIEKGAVIRSEDLVLIRPGTGIPPKEMKNIIGKIATRNIVAHKLIEKEDFE